MDEDRVMFKCVKIGSRLRVRVISPGYNPFANCQFPRAIRKDGGIYSAPVSALKFSQGANRKFFYRVAAKHVRVESVDTKPEHAKLVVKVYGDEDEECIVCMDNPKEVVFVPCGHYSTCRSCYDQLVIKKCVMCRNMITQAVNRDQIQT